MTTRNEAAERLQRWMPSSMKASWEPTLNEALAAAKAEGGQCDGYAGDPGASAPRCESYLGHPGRHFIRFDASAAKAEGAREAVERIRAEARRQRIYSPTWNAILKEAEQPERESHLGRDAEGHLVMTLGPGAESPSWKGEGDQTWHELADLSPLEQYNREGR